MRFRLMPEGVGTNALNVYDHNIYDCLVSVIICNRHETVALTNSKRLFSWFPFIPMPNVFTWNRISRDSLAIIMGNNEDSEIDATMNAIPEFTSIWLNIFRIQTKTGRFFQRITQLVKLEGEEGKCCQDNDRLRWVKLSSIHLHSPELANVWGGEVISYCQALFNNERTFLTEMALSSCFPSWNDSREALLLEQVKWPVERIHELLQDYIEHMYPAFQMSTNSFRNFLFKHDCLPKDTCATKIEELFQAFSEGKEWMEFKQLVYGLAAMDPKAKNDLDYRVKLIFQ